MKNHELPDEVTDLMLDRLLQNLRMTGCFVGVVLGLGVSGNDLVAQEIETRKDTSNGQTGLFPKIPSVGEWAEYDIKTFTEANGKETPFLFSGKLIIKVVAPPSKPKEKWVEIYSQVGSDLYGTNYYDVLKIPQPSGLPFGFKTVMKAKKAWAAHETADNEIPKSYSPWDPIKKGKSLKDMPNHFPLFVFPNVTLVDSGMTKTIETPFGKLKCKQLSGGWKAREPLGKINSIVFTSDNSPFGLVEAIHQTTKTSPGEQTLKYRFTLRKKGKDAKSLFANNW